MKIAQRKKAKVAAALRNFVKQSVARVKETVNSWGVPTFETDLPFSMYMLERST